MEAAKCGDLNQEIFTNKIIFMKVFTFGIFKCKLNETRNTGNSTSLPCQEIIYYPKSSSNQNLLGYLLSLSISYSCKKDRTLKN